MPRTPYATHIYDSPQRSSRNGYTPQYVVIHHAASTSFGGVVAMEMGTKAVSSTLVIKDGNIASMFDEQYRAWSLSSSYWDSVSLSIETCNESAGGDWPISEASYVSLAKVVADWCARYGIPCNRDRVIGHREVYTIHGASYATGCPGGIDLDRVVADANQILSGATTPAVDPIREKVRKMSLPLIIQQGEPGTANYGLNVALYPSGFYKWVNGQQRDAWIEAGAIFSNESSGHFAYFLGMWEEQQAYIRGQAKRSISEVLAELQAQEDASK